MRHPEEDLSAYIAGELTAEESSLLEDHLRSCKDCHTKYEDLRRLDEILKQTKPLEPSARFLQHVVNRAAQSEQRIVRFRSRPILVLIAVAAAVAFVVLVLRLLNEGAPPEIQVHYPPPKKEQQAKPSATANPPVLVVTDEEKELIANLQEIENLDLINNVENISDLEVVMMFAAEERR